MPKQRLVPFFARLTEPTRDQLGKFAYDNALSQNAVVEQALRAFFNDRSSLSDRIGQLAAPK